ncbi:MAG TPA: glycoside hydrolase family 38 C-terminal domain-containing protein, partial [Candidatus Baltobacteraceae bacterium]|nr:glycoside hydrolase family 38 C-terminal domain-containing protein [Candidatus Baltobacteraceae bacterium]
ERGRWTRASAWMQELARHKAQLPLHADELYLQYHRGVYTTHHDVKARNAELERKLQRVEEALAWCIAVRAPRDMVSALCARVDDAWRLVLRNQFHDVLPGTSIPQVYADAREEYDEVDALLDAVLGGTRNILPRGRAGGLLLERCEPLISADGTFLFDNGLVRAVLTNAGIITELSAPGGRSVVSSANVLTLYADRPKKWEAWNIDADYAKRTRKPNAGPATLREGSLVIPFAYRDSTFEMRISMFAGEPFLRVELDCDWQERRTLLRVENWLAIGSDEACYGTPHGTIVRSARAGTPQERAQFEVPGQRFAFVRDAAAGFVQFALDTYGWNARALPKGGMHLGHSLLRGTTWPDPDADRGRHQIKYAFAPFTAANTGAIEAAWNRFALESRVRLFVSDEDSVHVVACKPALDRDGVIVRIRECDGRAGTARIRSAGRVRSVEPCDALERPARGEAVSIEAEHIVAPIGAYALRSFRVRFA